MNRTFQLKLLSIATVLLLSLTGFANSKINKVRVVFTTDVHGAIFAYDFIEQKPKEGSLSQVYAYIKSLKAAKENYLLLDNGDMLQGQPTVYYYNFVDTLSRHLQSRVMNYMGYSALTVGNHDLEPGHPVYDRVRAESNFPWLAANAVKPSGKPYFEPYKVFKVAGKKIAVLGLITPAIPSWLPENIWSGMTFEDMVESAKKWINIIQTKEKPDAIIGLFHTGINFNYNNQNEETYKNENAAAIVAKRVKGFDAILFGHDHEVYNSKIVNSYGDTVQMLNPAAFARTVGVLSINFSGSKKILSGEIVDVKSVKPDPDFMAAFNSDFNKIKDYSSKEIGVLDETINAEDAYFGSSSFVDLVHRAALKESKADISMASPLMFNALIPAGTITVGDMFRLYKYENLLYGLKMSGQEIKDFLEYSYNLWIKKVDDPNNGMLLLNSSTHFKNPYYNFDSGAGLIYTVDITKDAGSRINIISLANGQPFELTNTYTVAMSSYRGNGGGGHLTFGAKIPQEEISKRIVYVSKFDLRYLIMNEIIRTGKLNHTPLNSWKFIPEDMRQKAESVDRKIIFNK